MNISTISIKRPVTTIVMSLIIITLGVVAFFRMQVRNTPNISPPIITVESRYGGADANYMENQITTPLEKSFKNLKNIDFISSSSASGSSKITLFFKLDTNLETSLSDVRSKISALSNIFPEDMSLPSASKFDVDNFASIWLSVSSENRDDLELTRIIDNQIKSEIEKLPAVGSAIVFGGRYYIMKIEPDLKKLQQYNISPIEIESMIRSQNFDYPVGFIRTESKRFSLKFSSNLNNTEDFGNIIIKKSQDNIVKLRDIADISLEPFKKQAILRYNGNNAIAIGLVLQSGENILDMSSDLKKALPTIKSNLPEDIKIEIAYNGAVPVKESINKVYMTIFEAIVLVGLVVYIFLGVFRLVIIPLVAIPISLIGTFFIMYLMGFSINTFTLLAMILAIGLVVDDAIVMMENIFRNYSDNIQNTSNHNDADIESNTKERKINSAIKGANEVSFAVFSMTITLAAVFLPIGFVEGFVGKLFIEFAWTLAFSVLISGFVALTLTPMMTAKSLINSDSNAFYESSKPYFIQKFNELFTKLTNIYLRILRKFLNNILLFSIILLITFISLILSFYFVKKEFTPHEDQGLLQVIFTGVEGSSLTRSEKTVLEAEKLISQQKGVKAYFEVIGSGGSPDSAFAFVPLLNWSKRDLSDIQIKNELNKKFINVPGMSIFAITPRSLGRGNSNREVEFYTQSSSGSYQDLYEITELFTKQMEQSGYFNNVEHDFKKSIPAVEIITNKDKATLYNTDYNTIGSSIQYLIAGKDVGDFSYKGDIYRVIMRLKEQDRNDPNKLSSIYIKSKNNQMIPLGSIAEFRETLDVKQYTHYNNNKAIKISADLNNITLNQAVSEIEKIKNKIVDKSKNYISYIGAIKQMKEADSNILFTFLLSLVFIYLVLSAQFESFKDSLIIMFSVPFSALGAVLFIILTGTTLNIYSNIGIVTLVGLVTKNAIMIVEFINQLKEQRKIDEVNEEMIIEALKLRFRPIIMTSIATTAGALPLIFSGGNGAASRASIGITISFGMIFGTIFTMFVIPMLLKIFKKS
ncbi:MAG TPA: efflux RND transporter permease subunit [Candidatus Megaira endosymbiont of Hartmannula sinica]|nr:efflux RND transporter permease subunit [Candidatus Megaera endosymbiont of Hartmannula sinica]